MEDVVSDLTWCNNYNNCHAIHPRHGDGGLFRPRTCVMWTTSEQVLSPASASWPSICTSRGSNARLSSRSPRSCRPSCPVKPSPKAKTLPQAVATRVCHAPHATLVANKSLSIEITSPCRAFIVGLDVDDHRVVVVVLRKTAAVPLSCLVFSFRSHVGVMRIFVDFIPKTDNNHAKALKTETETETIASDEHPRHATGQTAAA